MASVVAASKAHNEFRKETNVLGWPGVARAPIHHRGHVTVQGSELAVVYYLVVVVDSGDTVSRLLYIVITRNLALYLSGLQCKLSGRISSPQAGVLCNLVVARSNLLRIFEIREEPAPIQASVEEEREKRALVRKGTEAVEGEAAMDTQGDGFISIGKTIQKTDVQQATVTRMYFVREHKLHGTVTGLSGVRIISSLEDKLDRLLVSFKDAKIALLEWSDAVHDLVPVSIHTYERAPQLMSLTAPLFRSELRVDPLSRCAALGLPNHSIAILPFYQSQAELDTIDLLNDPTASSSSTRDVPYSPSFILNFAVQVDSGILTVIDFVFLPGFNNPTLAVLYQTEQTWTGRLNEFKDTTKLVVFTLDISNQSYPILTKIEGLPHDCMYLIPCTEFLVGGLVVVSGDLIIYIDSTRRVALPVNGWGGRISDLPLLPSTDANAMVGRGDLKLEGSRATFIDDKTLFLILKDGTLYTVEVVAEGKTVTKLVMGTSPLAQTAIPAVIEPLRGEYGTAHFFVGSTVGPSVLLKAAHVEEEYNDEEDGTANGGEGSKTAVVDQGDTMDWDDDDDDLYGSSKPALPTASSSTLTPATTTPKKTRTVLHLSLRDSLPAYGHISSLCFSLAQDGDKPVPELVCTTGTGVTGGFTLFQRDLPVKTKKKLLAVGGTRGLWALPVRQGVKSNAKSSGGGSGGGHGHAGGGAYIEKGVNPFKKEGYDTLVVSTDAAPSPGLSRISTRNPNALPGKPDVNITTRIPGTTVGAAPFFQRTAILVVMTNAIKVLEPDGSERQIIQDTDGKMPRPKIRSCSISDPFVLVLREDDSLGLFIGETDRGKIRRKDMSPMGDRASRYLAGCFYTDVSGLFEKHYHNSAPATDAATATLQAVVNAGAKSQWLLLVRPQGVFEIWTLPKLALAFSNDGISALHNVLVDSHEPAALSLPQDPPRKAQEFDVEQILLAPIGESDPKPHLCVFLRSGQLTVYQGLPLGQNPAEPIQEPRASHLDVKFVKVTSIAFEIQRSHYDELVASSSNPGSAGGGPGGPGGEKGATSASAAAGSTGSGTGGAVGAGSSILAEQKKIPRVFVPFVTTPPVVPNPGGAPTSTTYSGVFFTGDRPNWIFGTDHGGVQIYPSGHSAVNAFTTCSMWEERGDFLMYTEDGPTLLEWLPDFNYNYSLPSRSVPRGRSFSNVLFDPSTCLIVAASCMHAKFASYDEDGNRVWEADAPNVSDPLSETSALELISPDGWVTMDGFEFASNEYVNDVSIVTLETAATETGLKDFIAVGTTIDRGEDLAVKGAAYIFEIVEVVPDSAIAPTRWYKLRLRCRDDAKGPVTAVCGFQGYLVSSMGQKIFVRAFDSDERLVGVAFIDVGIYVTSLRTLKNLLLVGDVVKSVMFVAFQEDPYKLVLLAKDVEHHCITSADFFFTDDGELSIVTGDEEGVIRVYQHNPDVEENSFKRLQLLQGQLTRNIQHVAGLNPKAFRTVKNEYNSKPLLKGILDGNLLAHYESLPIARQNEMTQQIGTERHVVLKDWISLSGPW
ncbi:hypothetical protein H1R20_g6373, partial [Candolleomyces eurysporus]